MATSSARPAPWILADATGTATLSGIDSCGLVALPGTSDPRGNLTFVEGARHIPFEIRRIFYLHGVPAGCERGGHAHRTLHEFIIPVAGHFDIVLDDGEVTRRFHLDRPDTGLYVCPMVWGTLSNFSPGAVCLVAVSHRFDEADYIRDYPSYLAERKHPA